MLGPYKLDRPAQAGVAAERAGLMLCNAFFEIGTGGSSHIVGAVSTPQHVGERTHGGSQSRCGVPGPSSFEARISCAHLRMTGSMPVLDPSS